MRNARLVLRQASWSQLSRPPAIRQQPQGDPFSTEIRRVKDGLFVIPGYDGAVTGGNVAFGSRAKASSSWTTGFRLPRRRLPVKSGRSRPSRSAVFSSHNHGDHTGGHPEFIKVAEIIAHRNNRANMVRGHKSALPRVVFADQASVFRRRRDALSIWGAATRMATQ
jgi:hypothetical protein